MLGTPLLMTAGLGADEGALLEVELEESMVEAVEERLYWVELAGINGLPERHSLEWVSVTNGDEDQSLCQDFWDWKSKSTIDGLIAGLTATTRGVMPNIASSPCCLPPIHAQPLGGWKEAGNSQGEGKRGGDEDGTADDEERDGEGEAAEGSAEEARRMFDRGGYGDK
ncbi:hypothetical protein RHGRI_013573 [Rhododendron griersonianum]|uniref:Uncharacterized protein n=1 Tax=Rhododendron griersonianum TaxID=479676 RepID=A0AAV6K676_9ERIC|nr:hypothetical protein RHGRI_013573 [Rhododendron griersonianum]